MPDLKISELTLGTPAATDVIPFVDLATGTTKKAVKTDLVGAQGPQGAIGSQGATGSQGPQGTQGNQGNQGTQGVQGATGSQGAQGTQGATGSQGASGAQGSTGAQGATGSQGPQGNQGNQGSQGTQGNQGVAGGAMAWKGDWSGATAYVVNDAVVYNGSSYISIQNGTNQNPATQTAYWTLFAQKGAQGDQGTQGNKGDQGNQGTQGAQGSAGAKGDQGNQGYQGNQGNQGTQGNQGAQGAQGAQGTNGLSGGTLSGELDLGENYGLVLDAALSADGKYSGIVEAGTAGAALAFGDLCYLNDNDSRWELADANLSDGYDKKLGMCVLAAAADGDATKMLLWGKIRADAKFPTLTIGAPAYMSETAGAIVVAQPTTADAAIRVVGQANTADELFFNPSPDYITHT